METSGGLSLRVLTRPSSSSTPADSLPSLPSTPPPSFSSLQPPSPANGVVVVGVVGRSQDDVTHLLNRLLDAHIFGSGNRDRDLFDLNQDQEAALEDDDAENENENENGIKENKFRFKGSARRIRAAWSKKKRISYYLDEEKGVVYVQFAWGTPHLDLLMEDFTSQDYPSVLDRHEADDLCGLLVMFSVTPPFPTALATCPAVQFEESCIPDSIQSSQQYLNFSFGSRVVLPPESFLTLRLPFVYGALLNDGSAIPFLPRAHRPELTAWLVKGTTLQILLKEQDNESVSSL